MIKTSFEDEDERRLQDVFIKKNVYWVVIFLLVTKILNINEVLNIGYKDSENIRRLCIFHAQMIIYKRNFDKYRRIYVLIKKEKSFIKYIEILEKVRNVTKKT